MKAQDINYIIAHKKRKPEWGEYFLYTIAIVASIMLVFTFAAFVYECFIDTSSMTPPPDRAFAFFSCMGLVLSIPLEYLIIKRLRQNFVFKSIATPFPKAENYKLTVDICQQQQKFRVQQFPDYIICNYGVSLFAVSGLITIIPLDKEILINSHPDNGGRPNITFMKNVNNIKRFEKEVAARF